jgi:NTE family protein
MSHPDLPVTNPSRKHTVALALGAGGAKGLAHIGAIEEIERQGYTITAVAGTSMGALIGGIYAMGKLDVYRDWVGTLAKLDVLRLLDWSWSGGGLIKGEKLIGTLRRLIGDTQIEDLPIAFTAVATDIDREREVWLSRGCLFDAIRASIAIPTVFRPATLAGRRLVDGALLNPVPVTPLIRDTADYLIAISLDGPTEAAATPVANAGTVEDGSHRGRMGQFIGRLRSNSVEKVHEPGALELLTRSMDLMQANLARMRLAAYEPDLLIEIPRNASSAYEFYRARELIELGRQRAQLALDGWRRHGPESGPAAQPDPCD